MSAGLFFCPLVQDDYRGNFTALTSANYLVGFSAVLRNFWICSFFVDVCKKKACEYYSKCLRRADNLPECVCPICDSESKYNPVCGNDGMTYASLCQLQMTACKEKRNLKIVKKSACGEMRIFLEIDYFILCLYCMILQ